MQEEMLVLGGQEGSKSNTIAQVKKGQKEL